MKKRIRIFSMLFAIVFLIQSPCFASAQLQSDINEYYATQLRQEPILIETIGDGTGICTVAYGDCLYSDAYSDGVNTWRIEYTDAGTTNTYKEFVRYITNVWAINNPQYTVTEASTVSLSVTGGISVDVGKAIAGSLGWNLTLSTGMSVSTDITVLHPERYNKLALLADYNVQYIIPKIYKNGVLNSTGIQSTIKAPTELYYQVVYQNS